MNPRLCLSAFLFGTLLLPIPRAAAGPASGQRQSEPDQELQAPAPKPVPIAPVAPEGPLAGAWEKRSSYLRGRIFHSAVWTYSEMIVWGGGSEGRFYNDGGIYNLNRDEWRPVSQVNAPSGRWGHAAVWTGREMIVWGGRSQFTPDQHKNDGAIYNPITDSWRPMSREGAPEPRSQMAAVWTGDKLLVWGGWGEGGTCPRAGAAYDPHSDSWTPIPLENSPEGRMEPASVWTGRELIVWGGLLAGERVSCGTGGRYDPESRTWKALPGAGAPLSARGLQAVWTGREMLLWGGSHLSGESRVNIGLQTGARYNPETDSWAPTAIDSAPPGSAYYGAAWTGRELVVWGGGDQQKGNLQTGGRYEPGADRWVPTTLAGAPAGRGMLSALWTGEGVLLYGGSTGGFEAFNETFFYRPPAAP